MPVLAWPTLDPPAGARAFVWVRWLMLAVEAGVSGIAAFMLGADALLLGGIVGLGVLVQLGVTFARPGPALPHMAGAVLVFDAIRLTGLLALTGGASSPLSAAYLVHVALTGLLLPTGWTAAVVLTVLGGYGALFLWPPPRHHHHDMYAHVVGMWATVALVAPLVAGAIAVLRRALIRTAAAVAAAQEAQARDQRLAALGTLAAGAAHELATPLSTITIAAGELGRHVQDRPECAEDVALVQEQVKRCRDILSQLAHDAGAGMGELTTSQPLGDVLDDALDALDVPDRAACLERIELLGEDALLDREIALPRRLMAHVVAGLVKNALQASTGSVELAAREDGDRLVIEVRDQGAGMDKAVLDRAREPFFTTKAPGQGTGLGLFVAASTARQLGGELELQSEAGVGTTVRLRVPWGAGGD